MDAAASATIDGSIAGRQYCFVNPSNDQFEEVRILPGAGK
jgi:hypothetical protein